MTVGDLIREFGRHDPESEVVVHLHSEHYPKGSLVAIQGFVSLPPWHGDDGGILGLTAHAENKELMPDAAHEEYVKVLNDVLIKIGFRSRNVPH